ncbi:DUF7284 family protein [Haladaptatus salinisoli]|uniref:DUF7284 family protein n=1 Tax=Haladaptatus salinisoli TaxID=2884876 RepID=UPI001D0B6E5C|nr:hypothetical protein [Haladaptatus salinisoli]
MRAISTVLDATLCLLLVSASAFVLAGAEPSRDAPDARTAESTADVLATSTARVNYTIPSESRSLRRTTHDTLAGLLADAAVANATVRDVELARTSDDFERAVARRVRGRLSDSTNVQVVARWEPYRNAHLRGRFVVGGSPPPKSTVHAAVVSVPSGLPTVREEAVDAARRRGYRGVARVVAAGAVSGLAPPRATELALDDRNRVATIVAARFRRFLWLYDGGSTQFGDDGVQTRGELVRATTLAIEDELRATYETPRAAARSVSAGRVELVVRTWSG